MCTPKDVGGSLLTKQARSSLLKYVAPDGFSCTMAVFQSHAAIIICSSGVSTTGAVGKIIFERIGFAQFSSSLIQPLLPLGFADCADCRAERSDACPKPLRLAGFRHRDADSLQLEEFRDPFWQYVLIRERSRAATKDARLAHDNILPEAHPGVSRLGGFQIRLKDWAVTAQQARLPGRQGWNQTPISENRVSTRIPLGIQTSGFGCHQTPDGMASSINSLMLAARSLRRVDRNS
jgi:hypothetical protein